MQKIIHLWQKLTFKQLLWFTVAISVLLSLAELSTNRPIDPDSITFINAAHTYWRSGWHATLPVYPWPFFPILCVSLSHLFGLPLVSVFHLLNTGAQALLCVAFVLLSKWLTAPLRTQKIAALVILLFPFLNSIRFYATRESGYWAFALLAVCFLVRFLSRHKTRDAIAFGVCMLIAFLFRMEGLLLLIAAPLAIAAMPHHRWRFKWRLWWRANTVLLMLCAGALLYYLATLLLHIAPVGSGAKASRLHEYTVQIQHLLPHLAEQLNHDAALMGQAMLSSDAQPTQTLLLVGGLVTLCFIMIISVMQPLLAILAFYSQRLKLLPNQHGQATLLYWLLIVNLAILLLFTIENYFLATRYPAFLTLLWLSWVPFILVWLHDEYRAKRDRLTGRAWFFPLLLTVLLCIAAGGIIRFGYSKAYITQAGHWLQKNTPENALIYTNSKEVSFYAAANNEDDQRLKAIKLHDLTNDTLKDVCQYEWLALRLNHNDAVLKQAPTVQQFVSTHTALIVFANKRRDSVAIYDLRPTCHR